MPRGVCLRASWYEVHTCLHSMHALPCHTHNSRLCGCNSSFPLIAYINTVIWFFREHRVTQLQRDDYDF